MLSRNNFKEQLRKQEPKKQRFAIRKLTVGVASVLVGFTLMGMSVSADTTSNTDSAVDKSNDQTANVDSNVPSAATKHVTLQGGVINLSKKLPLKIGLQMIVIHKRLV